MSKSNLPAVKELVKEETKEVNKLKNTFHVAMIVLGCGSSYDKSAEGKDAR